MTVFKRRARRDGIEPELVETIRAMGGYVVYLNDKVDLVVGWRGLTVLFEVKRPPGPCGGVSKAKLTDEEANFFRDWPGGPLFKVDSSEDVIRCLEGVWKTHCTQGYHATRRLFTHN